MPVKQKQLLAEKSSCWLRKDEVAFLSLQFQAIGCSPAACWNRCGPDSLQWRRCDVQVQAEYLKEIEEVASKAKLPGSK